MGINTVIVPIIDQRGNRVPTLILVSGIVDANETLDHDVWLSLHEHTSERQ